MKKSTKPDEAAQAATDTAPTGRRTRRRGLWIAAGVLVGATVLFAGIGAVWLRSAGALPGGPSSTAPDNIPLVDLSAADPTLAPILERARAKVVAAPQSSAAWLEYGMQLEAMVFPEHALIAYREAFRLDPSSVGAKYYLAILLASQRETDESMRLLRELEAADPNYPPFPVRLGDVLVMSGQLPEAEAAYRRALALDADYPFAHRQLGLALLAAGNAPGAIEHLERAISLQDDDRRTYAALAQAYRMQGNEEKTAELAAKAEHLQEHFSTRDSLRLPLYRLRPEVRDSRILAQFALRFGRYEQAIPSLLTAVSAWPDDPELLGQLSRAYAMTNQPELAERYRLRAERAQQYAATPSPVPAATPQADS